jgi:outer membrane protein OmpA-like peptidoglycan-associated protein
MNPKQAFTILITVAFPALIFAQSETYAVKKAYFSTDKYDEFAPVCYKNGVVFCSNKSVTRLKSYAPDDSKGFLKIIFADSVEGSLQPPHFFSKKLNSNLNDGPVTFSRKGDTIFYSRNLIVDGKVSEISSTRNKLGIFYAVLDGSEWSKIRELRINNEWYNVTTPWLSPDGTRLFFASDKAGGFGGSDIYYSQWKNDYWEDPVNMGPSINTPGNESYPFMNAAGEFFYSSDGLPGHGGKDIFFSHLIDTTWSVPVCLDAPVNSKFDDFGIYTDSLMEKGYFSSNRDKSLDIFEFKTVFPQIFYTSVQKENNYCFAFADSGSIAVDTLNLKYVWSFGDGDMNAGAVTTHCFPGPGKYRVTLDIVQRSTGKIYFTKRIDDIVIHDFRQAYINAPEMSVKGEDVKFDGLKSSLPGYRILSYSWDFGDKSRAKGEKVSHSFKTSGDYTINLELALRSDSTGMIKKTGVSKLIKVFNTKAESAAYAGMAAEERKTLPDYRYSQNAGITVRYAAESEVRSDAVFRVEILSSKNKVDMNGPLFKNIPSGYVVKEKFDPLEGGYSYTVDQHLNLMSAYPTYNKMLALGFREARVRMMMLTDPAEKELFTLMRINGINTDNYFDFSERLTSTAFIMLDQIVRLLNRYPTLKLEIGVHTDNSVSADAGQTLTQRRAQILQDYLTNRGVNARRLSSVGYGNSKPVTFNLNDREKKQNRRVDFTILGR